MKTSILIFTILLSSNLMANELSVDQLGRIGVIYARNAFLKDDLNAVKHFEFDADYTVFAVDDVKNGKTKSSVTIYRRLPPDNCTITYIIDKQTGKKIHESKISCFE